MEAVLNQKIKEKWNPYDFGLKEGDFEFESCFPTIFDLADILGMTVRIFGFLNFRHLWPSISPGSQHFFLWTRFPQSGKKLLNLFRQPFVP